LLWSLHPSFGIADSVESANDNAYHIVLIARHTVPHLGQSFPHARAGQRPSTRQGEAQLAQGRRPEQAGGWGLIHEMREGLELGEVEPDPGSRLVSGR